MADEPTPDELYEENLALLEEKEALMARVRSLEQQAFKRETNASSDRLSAEIERLRGELERRTNDIKAAQLEAESVAKVAKEAQSNVAHLEQMLAEKDERLRETLKAAAATHEEAKEQSVRALGHRQTALERQLTEAMDESDRKQAAVTTLESQIRVLEGALSAAAEEKDEVQALHARDVAALDAAEGKNEELSLLLEEANDGAEELRRERDRLEAELARVEAESAEERKRLQPKTEAADALKLLDKLRSELDELRRKLEVEMTENSRLDAENVELAVLADFLRQRITALEEVQPLQGMDGPASSTDASREKHLAVENVEHVRALENQVAQLEVELDDTRELLALGTENGGLGTAEVIRRNKELKAIIRKKSSEVEDARDTLATHRAGISKLEAAVKRYKSALSTCRDDNELKRLGAPDHFFDDLVLSADVRSASAQLEANIDLLRSERDELEADRSRLLQRLRNFYAEGKAVSSSRDSEDFNKKGDGNSSPNLPRPNLDDFERALDLERKVHHLEVARKRDALRIIDLEEKLQGSGSGGDMLGDNAKNSVLLSKSELDELRRDLAAATSKCAPNGSSNNGHAPAISHHNEAGHSSRTKEHEEFFTSLSARIFNVLEAQERSNAALAKRLDAALNEVASYRGRQDPKANLASVQSSPPSLRGISHHPISELDSKIRSNITRDASGYAWLTKDEGNKLSAVSSVPQIAWVKELGDLRRALARALEALDASEQERQQQDRALSITSGKLVSARHQIAVLYDRYSAETAAHASTLNELKAKTASLIESKQALNVELENARAAASVTNGGQDLQLKVQELIRRVTTLEGNELVLQRRYHTVCDELNAEAAQRHAVEIAGSEVELAVLSRLMYLELWKQAATVRLDSLEAELNSVQGDAQSASDPENALLAVKTAREEAYHAQMEARRSKAIASAAATQAAELARLRDVAISERDSLIQRARDLEATSDTNRCIGKLQRELMAARSAHRRLAHRYEKLRGQLRQRSAALRSTQTKLEAVTQSASRARDEQRARVSALHAVAAARFQDSSSATSNKKEPAKADEEKVASLEQDVANFRTEYNKARIELEASRVEIENLRLSLGFHDNAHAKHSERPAAQIVAKRLTVLGEEVKDLKIARVRDSQELVELRATVRRLSTALQAEKRATLDANHARVEAECWALVSAAETPHWNDLMTEAGNLEVMLSDKEALPLQAINMSGIANASPAEIREQNRAITTATVSTLTSPRLLPHVVETQRSYRHSQPVLSPASPAKGGTRDASSFSITGPDRTRLTQVASQTIASLRTVVAEKNRIISALESRLEVTRETSQIERRADWSEIQRLNQKLYEEHANSISSLKDAANTLATQDAVHVTTNREELESALSDARTLRQANRELEVKVREALQSRKRAEMRAEEALNEVERHKVDLVKLAAHVRSLESDLKQAQAPKRTIVSKSRPTSSDKVQALRETIVGLKKDVLRAEESLAESKATRRSQGQLENDTMVSELRDTVSILKNQLADARRVARSSQRQLGTTREKLESANSRAHALADEVERMSQSPSR